jgi:hypothetical protein
MSFTYGSTTSQSLRRTSGELYKELFRKLRLQQALHEDRSSCTVLFVAPDPANSVFIALEQACVQFRTNPSKLSFDQVRLSFLVLLITTDVAHALLLS